MGIATLGAVLTVVGAVLWAAGSDISHEIAIFGLGFATAGLLANRRLF